MASPLPQRLQRVLRRSRWVLPMLMVPVMLASLLTSAGESLQRIVLLVVGFGAIIFFHELGHFMVAKACSVKCEVFSLGIGPRMLGWRAGHGFTFGAEPVMPGDSKEPAAAGTATAGDLQQTAEDKPSVMTASGAVKINPDTPNLTNDILGKPNRESKPVLGETDYRLSWFPLGGYVRMLGQDDMDPTKVSIDPRAFNNRPIWQRMCIVSAGVIMNLIFAVIIFAIVFKIGVLFPPAEIGIVEFGSPADVAGLQVGDKIVAINGKRPEGKDGFVEFIDLQVAAALSQAGDKVKIEYVRPGETSVRQAELEPKLQPSTGLYGVGVGSILSLDVAKLTPDQASVFYEKRPYFKAVKGQDRVVAVNGQKIDDYTPLYRAVQESKGQPIDIVFRSPDGQETTVSAKPDLAPRLGNDGPYALLGLQPQTQIEKVLPDMPAKAAGFEPGDVVLRVGETTNPTPEQVIKIINDNANQKLSFQVQRKGETKVLTPTANRKGLIGIMPTPATESMVVANVVKPEKADAAEAARNELRGRKLLTLNGTPLKNWTDFYVQLRTLKEGDVAEIAHVDPAAAADAAPQVSKITLGAADVQALRGYQFQLGLVLEPKYLPQRADTLMGSTAMGITHTGKFILQTYQTLHGLFTRRVDPSQLHGIVGIAKIGYDVQQRDRGLTYLMFFLGLISVNLAVANFLPLPIVDGGLFLFLILEKIRGKPLSLKVQSVIQNVGVVLLVGLFLYVTFNDISAWSRL